MLARFFIDRPVFASVLSVLVTLAGGLAVGTLPIAQYPPITPPTIQVECNYPGASARVVAEAIAAPIEQQVNGVEDMMYMSSASTNDGSYNLTVTFRPGVDLNMAQVLVQNRVNLAVPLLPDVVRQTGVTTKKRSPDILMTISLNSPDGTYDQLYLSNYAVRRMVDELARLPGIGEVRVFGQRDYSMRVWADPDRLASLDLSAADVVNALREQNAQVAAGHAAGPVKQFTLDTLGRLEDIDQFENVVVKAGADGRVVRLKDVARVGLEAKSYDISNRFDGKPTVGLAVFALPDANALATADAVKATVERQSRDFPPGMVYEVGYDTTPFIRESMEEVFKSLRDSIILVALVVVVFLQSWRSALIPLIAVPVAVVGTFAAMAVVGFSLNNLTLFGLVLAIGIVVDDAIVVVEAVEQHIERGLAPREAAIKAMEEVTGPVIAIGLVLAAVFIPGAFLTGIIGQFFRQFALTIAIATAISTFVSLSLSPALAAILLPPKGGATDPLSRVIDFLFGWFFRLFNLAFRAGSSAYAGTVGASLRVPWAVLVLYAGLVAGTWWGYLQLPTGFIPQQDKGYLVASVQLPDAAAVGRTKDVIAKIEAAALATPGVKNVNSIAGNSFLLGTYGSNFGSMFIILKPFAERKHDPALGSDAIAAALRRRYASEIPEAQVNIFGPPAVSGLGRAGGFRFMVEDRGDAGLEALQGQTDNFIEKANQQPQVSGLFTVFKTNSPQLFIDIDRRACLTQGLALADVFSTLQVYLGSRYVNDFNLFGRTWQVIVQADADFRDQLEDVRRLKVRNNRGQMVPLGTVATVREVSGPLVVTRYNMYPAATVNGNVAPGVSSGDAIAVLERLADQELPGTMSYEWTELTYIERTAGGTGLAVFAASVVFVFLVLAALYESWTLPLAVILVVPVCVLGSIAAVAAVKQDINIFTQVGFVVLIGLAGKNAILIVEYAKAKRDAGASAREATLAACRQRLRPILMTSFAFILGVLPLVWATGAGSEMRRALGTAVFGGMLAVTLFGIFLTPVFFFVIDRAGEWVLRSSPWLRRLSAASLGALGLRFLWRRGGGPGKG